MSDIDSGADFGGEGATGTDFMAGLNDDNRAFAEERGWQSPEAVFDDYRALEGEMSGALHLPGSDATSEDHQSFYKKVSEGWTPKDRYQFQMPETLPEDFPYDQGFAEEAGGWFREAGLHPLAAQKLHDRWVGKMAELHGQSVEDARNAAQAQAEAMETAHRELVKDYGAPESDGYRNVVAKADRAMNGLTAAGIDVSSWFAEKGILTEADENGLQQVSDPTAVRLLAFIHDKALSEDRLDDLGEGGSGPNPFDRTKPNLKKQSEILEANPARARQLVVAAGRDPGLFGL